MLKGIAVLADVVQQTEQIAVFLRAERGGKLLCKLCRAGEVFVYGLLAGMIFTYMCQLFRHKITFSSLLRPS